jgi:hypothetical protein
MTPSEADAKWNATKIAMMADLRDLPQGEKINLIEKAADYRSGPDPYNSVYMGSMATASLMHALGGSYGVSSLKDLLARASDAQLTAGLEPCLPVIQAMHR